MLLSVEDCLNIFVLLAKEFGKTNLQKREGSLSSVNHVIK